MKDLDISYRMTAKGVVVEYRDNKGVLQCGFAVPYSAYDLKSLAIIDLVERLLDKEQDND